MRDRRRVIGSLEDVYREAYRDAEARGDGPGMERLDFEFRRDQVWMEVLLDVRDLLLTGEGEGEEGARSLLEQARALRDLTRGR